MKRFVEGVGRGQTTLFPECLEDWIDEGNPVRAIDTFVEKLDLRLARNDANGQGPAVACSIVGGGAE
jgi:transposase